MTHIHTKYTAGNGTKVKKYTHKLYSVTKTGLFKIMQNSPRLNIYAAYKAFSKTRFLPVHRCYDRNIHLEVFRTSSEACVFLAFSYFDCILHSDCLCQSARQGSVDFKQSCPIEQHFTGLPALPLKHPGWSMLSCAQSISHYWWL